jgi:hypothetical protein
MRNLTPFTFAASHIEWKIKRMPFSPSDLNNALTAIAAPETAVPSSATVIHGRGFPPQQQILLYSADEWEEFIREWVHSQKSNYIKVARLTGAGDCGIDVAGLTDAKGLKGVWDCFQCKHYDDPLTPTTSYPELGKILWYSFNERYSPPRAYYFIAPKGCGPKLQQLLLDSANLQLAVISKWDEYCGEKIKSKAKIPLEGDFLAYAQDFDFSIFSFKTSLDIIDDHNKTPYFTSRFGGGLPVRPASPAPPPVIATGESEYIKQLYQVYSEECGSDIHSANDLQTTSANLSNHLDRQRECFYSAEALRNFARDAVPEGTFEDLQSEVFAGIIDHEQASHPSSMARLTAVTQAATSLAITANGLISVTRIQDRKGICHQLANEDRLRWRKF